MGFLSRSFRIKLQLAAKAVKDSSSGSARASISARRVRLSKRIARFNRKFGSILPGFDAGGSDVEDNESDEEEDELVVLPENEKICLPSVVLTLAIDDNGAR